MSDNNSSNKKRAIRPFIFKNLVKQEMAQYYFNMLLHAGHITQEDLAAFNGFYAATATPVFDPHILGERGAEAAWPVYQAYLLCFFLGDCMDKHYHASAASLRSQYQEDKLQDAFIELNNWYNLGKSYFSSLKAVTNEVVIETLDNNQVDRFMLVMGKAVGAALIVGGLKKLGNDHLHIDPTVSTLKGMVGDQGKREEFKRHSRSQQITTSRDTSTFFRPSKPTGSPSK